MTHRVLNGMLEGGRMSEVEVVNANIMAREIASQHPVILLRLGSIISHPTAYDLILLHTPHYSNKIFHFATTPTNHQYSQHHHNITSTVPLPLRHRRQLPLMISMLEGKLQMTYTELRSTNSISLFNHYLNLLHLLKPHIFRPYHHPHLSSIINIYLKLMVGRELFCFLFHVFVIIILNLVDINFQLCLHIS